MTLLQQLDHERSERREALRREVRRQLRDTLVQLAPAKEVLVFGSLARPHRFSEYSDVDIALADEPATMSIYRLTALLSEHLGRPVDVVVLSECRFRDRILKEGELWTLTA